MSETDLPDEPDRRPGCPHPRERYDLAGHEAAEAELASAITSGRLHHGWLITGPSGVGKATLAYRAARRMLGAAPDGEGLSANPSDPNCRRIEAQSHPGLLVIRRPWDDKTKKFKSVITVDELRRVGEFFSLSAGADGWRIAIVDSVDEMNPNAANALLKSLEEPPRRTILFLLTHTPGKLLPTIRSRCRRLTLRAPGIDATAAWLTRQSGVSDPLDWARRGKGLPGEALAMARSPVHDIAETLDGLLSGLPRLDASRSRALANRMNGKDKDAARDAFNSHILAWTMERARASGRAGQDPEPWTAAWRDLRALAGAGEGLYLDPKQVALSALHRLQEAARTADAGR
ncbi:MULTISPECIES: DNA polymerase III subunit delta' [Hyphobacterium]|uniref:DNA polymerase III subunit delta n=1 Tax=Hyphobacterium vulgare TaxID=1736751 RepID=A0ABV6ZT42_9PROT